MNNDKHENAASALSTAAGSDPACIYCARRDNCMAYSDEELVRGAKEGHVPRIKDNCTMFQQGNSYTRQHALEELDKFKEYAKDLIRAHSNQNAKDEHA